MDKFLKVQNKIHCLSTKSKAKKLLLKSLVAIMDQQSVRKEQFIFGAALPMETFHLQLNLLNLPKNLLTSSFKKKMGLLYLMMGRFGVGEETKMEN